jgi:hypothetical protein
LFCKFEHGLRNGGPKFKRGAIDWFLEVSGGWRGRKSNLRRAITEQRKRPKKNNENAFNAYLNINLQNSGFGHRGTARVNKFLNSPIP